MLELYLLRHGKSDWNNFEVEDRARKVSIKGIKRSKLVGKYIKENKIEFDKIICSPAIRTQETMKIICGFINNKPEINTMDLVYSEGEKELLKYIKTQEDYFSKILIIGHQPTLSNLIKILSNDLRNEYFVKATCNYRTSGFFKLIFEENSWKKISFENSRIVFYLDYKTLSIP